MTRASLEGRVVTTELEYKPAEPTGVITIREKTAWETCPKCGELRNAYWYHSCTSKQDISTPVKELTTPIPENPGGKAPLGDKDPKLIWDDCPQCAMKHLSAAYASLTSGTPVRDVADEDVYVARALIAIRESETGYLGNLALAVGCLAMAELLAAGGNGGTYFRDARFRVLDRDYRHAREIINIPSAGAFAAAHLTEAMRELPAITDRFQQERYFSDSGFHIDNVPETLDMLRKLIRWVSETYELMKGAE